jgi:hypothetical protein
MIVASFPRTPTTSHSAAQIDHAARDFETLRSLHVRQVTASNRLRRVFAVFQAERQGDAKPAWRPANRRVAIEDRSNTVKTEALRRLARARA